MEERIKLYQSFIWDAYGFQICYYMVPEIVANIFCCFYEDFSNLAYLVKVRGAITKVFPKAAGTDTFTDKFLKAAELLEKICKKCQPQNVQTVYMGTGDYWKLKISYDFPF
jgi:hypothetical protein